MPTDISRSGSGNGSGRSRTALIKLKIAVVAPMPSASVRIVVRAKPGLLRNWRIAKRRSCSRCCIKLSRKRCRSLRGALWLKGEEREAAGGELSTRQSPPGARPSIVNIRDRRCGEDSSGERASRFSIVRPETDEESKAREAVARSGIGVNRISQGQRPVPSRGLASYRGTSLPKSHELSFRPRLRPSISGSFTNCHPDRGL